jgi:hypothetical protein
VTRLLMCTESSADDTTRFEHMHLSPTLDFHAENVRNELGASSPAADKSRLCNR